MLPWQIGLLNRKLGAQAGLEQRCLRGGSQAPEGSMNLWLGPLLVLITVVFGFRLIRSRSRCFTQSDQESPLEVGRPEGSLQYMPCPPASFARTQAVQQAASCAGNAGVAAVQVQTEQVQGKHFWQNCASVFDSTTVPWSHVRRNTRFMLLSRSGRKHLIVPTLAQLKKKKKVSCPVVLEVPSESASGKI